MWDVVGEILTPAVATAISVAPILAVVVTLTSRGGRGKSFAFAICWFISVFAATFVLAKIGSGWTSSDDTGEPSAASGWLQVGLGALMLLIAITQWRGRPRGGAEAETPGWLAAIDGFTPAKTAALAGLLGVVNLKNLPLIVGAGVTIAQADLSSGATVGACLIFAAVASLGVAAPVAAVLVLGEERSSSMLQSMRSWLTQNNNIIMALIFLLLGVNFIGGGIEVLG